MPHPSDSLERSSPNGSQFPETRGSAIALCVKRSQSVRSPPCNTTRFQGDQLSWAYTPACVLEACGLLGPAKVDCRTSVPSARNAWISPRVAACRNSRPATLATKLALLVPIHCRDYAITLNNPLQLLS